MGIFGWSLPPGVSMNDIDPEPGPCDICGKSVDDCICPECPQCGGVGDPQCYGAHGLTKTPDQIASRAAAEAAWKAQADVEAAFDAGWEVVVYPDEESAMSAEFRA